MTYHEDRESIHHQVVPDPPVKGGRRVPAYPGADEQWDRPEFGSVPVGRRRRYADP